MISRIRPTLACLVVALLLTGMVGLVAHPGPQLLPAEEMDAGILKFYLGEQGLARVI